MVSLHFLWRLDVKRISALLLAMALLLASCSGINEGKDGAVNNPVPSKGDLPGTPQSDQYDEESYSAMVMDTLELHDGAVYDFSYGDTLEDILALRESFDVNSYFDIFSHIRVKEGYVFDYIFDTYADGGPIMYFLPTEEYNPDITSYYSVDEDGFAKLETRPQGRVSEAFGLIRYLEIDNTREGYLEFAIFSTLAGQFALKWHSNYFDHIPVISKDTLDYVLENMWGWNITNTDIKEARKIDTAPVIRETPEGAEVSIIYFTKWGGFIKRTIVFDTTVFDNIEGTWITGVEEETILEYDCGVMF